MNPQTILPGSEAWPSRVDALAKPPKELVVVGRIPAGPRVAIVGTRRADRAALAFTETLAKDLARLGVCIVSGGAFGVDAAAHRGALAEGSTVAVLAGDIHNPAPRAHAALFEAVPQRGAIVSEHEGGIERATDFLKRNRLIAALADATIVVQAPARSGALSTARHCLRLNRPLLVVPAAPWDPRGKGNLGLLDKGLVCRGVKDVAEVLRLRIPRRRQRARKSALPQELATVREVLSNEPRHVDELARALDRDVALLQQQLLALVLRGEAVCEDGRWLAASR
ncbi:MAG: DNA-processing protein DprA [Myxococcota bacterium]